MRDHLNSAVSRKHLRLSTHGSLLTIEDRSSTGTAVDRLLLLGRCSYDLANGSVALRAEISFSHSSAAGNRRTTSHDWRFAIG